MKNIVISAQMGAASNIIKNILLLSSDVYWPNSVPRLDLVMKQYDKNFKTDKTQWIPSERLLNNQLANNCFLMEVDYFKFQSMLNFPKPGVFINHSLYWELPINFKQQQEYVDFLFVMPVTNFGLEWQMRAIYEKKCLVLNDNEFYDYCFAPEDRDKKVQEYINQFGKDEYFRYNVWNAKQIIAEQQNNTLAYIKQNKLPLIYLEDIILGSAQSLCNQLETIFKINIPLDYVEIVLDEWKNLHWNVAQTFDWVYSSNNIGTIKEL